MGYRVLELGRYRFKPPQEAENLSIQETKKENKGRWGNRRGEGDVKATGWARDKGRVVRTKKGREGWGRV